MEDQQGEIRIYVACLAAYNNGILHGCWINADQDVDGIRAGINAMLKASPIAGAEEYAIHDYEGFEGASLSEYQGIESVAELAAFIAEHGELGGKLVEYFGDLDAAREAIEDHYAGQYQSVADFAQELTEQSAEIPKALEYYIDWERMARDLAINDVLTIETGFECVHIFWRH
jgi:antirestriction protein